MKAKGNNRGRVSKRCRSDTVRHVTPQHLTHGTRCGCREWQPCHARQPSSLTRHLRDPGQILPLVAMLLPLLIALAGVLADAGRLLVEYRRAQVAIDSAAFAAAQMVDADTFRATQAVVLSGQAVSVGGLYGSLNSRGDVRVTSIAVSGGQVTAYGYTRVSPVFLRMFGVGPVTLQLASRGIPAYGISQENQ